MMILPVTLTIAAAAAVVNLWLAFRIVPTRLKDKVLVGDNDDLRLRSRMRAHANFTEYAPFVLILMSLIELAGGSSLWLWIAGIAFVLGRLAHGLGMDRTTSNPLRAGGIMATWLVLAFLAGWAIVTTYQAEGNHAHGVITLEPAAKG